MGKISWAHVNCMPTHSRLSDQIVEHNIEIISALACLSLSMVVSVGQAPFCSGRIGLARSGAPLWT